jgi:hypothetical protein
LDVITALGIIGRGLVANILIVLPVLLLCVWLTLFNHPTVESLSEPNVLVKLLPRDWLGLTNSDSFKDLWGRHGYWLTAILVVVNVIFLVVWAFQKSFWVSQFWQNEIKSRRQLEYSPELRGGFVIVSQLLFFITLTSAWFETQPFILRAMAEPASYKMGVCGKLDFSSDCYSAVLHGWFTTVTLWLAPVGAAFAFLSKYLGDIVAVAKQDTRWLAWLKKILAMAALWFSAIIIPSFLWLLYLKLTYYGITENAQITHMLHAYAPDWLRQVAHVMLRCMHWLQNYAPGWLTRLVHCLVPSAAASLYLFAFAVAAVLALCINPNATSLYRLYRDRLSKAFLFDPSQPRDKHGDLEAYEPNLHNIDTNRCPYPIINASLNIERSPYANKRGRNADFFIFTPEYTGSDATGYIGSLLIKKDETALDLGTAMAISAAAVSSNMGSATIKPLAFTLALLNMRLGYWLRNPGRIVDKRPWYRRFLFDIRSVLLFAEAFSWIDEKSRMVYLTDGGHIENLGVYSLLKRRCKVIIAIDAEADPAMSFNAFLTLERYARIDLGVIIELPWRAIRDCTIGVDKAFEKANKDGSAIPSSPGPHCAAGEIQYGPNDNEKGILLYVKASLSGDEDDYILDYKRRHRAFPHETTGDQFFGEEQLEAYRALGFHIMSGLLTGEKPFAVEPDPKLHETDGEAQLRILKQVREALGT